MNASEIQTFAQLLTASDRGESSLAVNTNYCELSSSKEYSRILKRYHFRYYRSVKLGFTHSAKILLYQAFHFVSVTTVIKESASNI